MQRCNRACSCCGECASSISGPASIPSQIRDSGSSTASSALTPWLCILRQSKYLFSPQAEGIQDVIEFLRNTRELVVWEINGFEQVWDTAAHEEFKVSTFTPPVAFITKFPPCCRLCWCPPSLTGWWCRVRPGGTLRWARSGTGPGSRRTRAGLSSPTTPTLTQENRAEKRRSHIQRPSSFPVHLSIPRCKSLLRRPGAVLSRGSGAMGRPRRT